MPTQEELDRARRARYDKERLERSKKPRPTQEFTEVQILKMTSEHGDEGYVFGRYFEKRNFDEHCQSQDETVYGGHLRCGKHWIFRVWSDEAQKFLYMCRDHFAEFLLDKGVFQGEDGTLYYPPPYPLQEVDESGPTIETSGGTLFLDEFKKEVDK